MGKRELFGSDERVGEVRGFVNGCNDNQVPDTVGGVAVRLVISADMPERAHIYSEDLKADRLKQCSLATMFSTPLLVDLKPELSNLRNCRQQILDGKVGHYDRLLFNDRLTFSRHFTTLRAPFAVSGGSTSKGEYRRVEEEEKGDDLTCLQCKTFYWGEAIMPATAGSVG